MSPDELAKLFETASERWAMMTSIADPAKLDNYVESKRLCDLMAQSLRMALVDETEFVNEITQLSIEMENAKFCTKCGQKLTFGVARCPKCGKRVIEP